MHKGEALKQKSQKKGEGEKSRDVESAHLRTESIKTRALQSVHKNTNESYIGERCMCLRALFSTIERQIRE